MQALFSFMVGTVEQVSSRDKYILTLNVFFFVCFWNLQVYSKLF